MPVPVPKVSVVCEVSGLEPPEVSVEKPGGLLSVLSEPDTLLSGELQAIAYDRTAKNKIFLIWDSNLTLNELVFLQISCQ